MVMKNYRATLPPLDTLVFFEAAARHLNFSRAAEELAVSQTAVSKRIRQLEDHLDIALFLRDGRKITLTPEGQMFAQKCRTLLDHAVQSLPNAAPKDAAIQIVCCSAISLFWLDERLGDYMQHPWSPVVNCMTTDDPDLLLNTQFDLTILYGAGTWEGWEAQPLFENDEVAVAAGKEANLEWEAQNTPPILIDTCVPNQVPAGSFGQNSPTSSSAIRSHAPPMPTRFNAPKQVTASHWPVRPSWHMTFNPAICRLSPNHAETRMPPIISPGQRCALSPLRQPQYEITS